MTLLHRQGVHALLRSFLLAVSVASPAAAAEPIVIGQSVPLSGLQRETGKDLVLGGRIYFDHINSQGGIRGRKIKLVAMDDGYEVERTANNTNLLLNDSSVVALFGYAGTGNVHKLLTDQVLKRAGIALVGPYTGGESLRTPYNPHIFHIRAGYVDETSAMVKMLTGGGVRRIGVMYQDDPFGKAGLQGVTDALKRLNLEPVVSASYPKNTADVKLAVTTIAAANPQAVILISVNKSSAAFVTLFRELNQGSQIFNVSVVNPTMISHIAGHKATRGFSIAQVIPSPSSTALPVAREYRALLARYGNGAQPSYVSFEEFLAAKTLVEGLRRAKKPTRAALITALESIYKHDLGGFTVSFGPNNRRGSTLVEMVAISRDGKLIH